MECQIPFSLVRVLTTLHNGQVKTGNDQVKGGNNDASKKKSPVAVEPVSEKQDLQVCALHICAVAVLIL